MISFRDFSMGSVVFIWGLFVGRGDVLGDRSACCVWDWLALFGCCFCCFVGGFVGVV